MSKNPPNRPRKAVKEIWQGKRKKRSIERKFLNCLKEGAHVEELLKVLPISRDVYYDLVKKRKRKS